MRVYVLYTYVYTSIYSYIRYHYILLYNIKEMHTHKHTRSLHANINPNGIYAHMHYMRGVYVGIYDSLLVFQCLIIVFNLNCTCYSQIMFCAPVALDTYDARAIFSRV